MSCSQFVGVEIWVLIKCLSHDSRSIRYSLGSSSTDVSTILYIIALKTLQELLRIMICNVGGKQINSNIKLKKKTTCHIIPSWYKIRQNFEFEVRQEKDHKIGGNDWLLG